MHGIEAVLLRVEERGEGEDVGKNDCGQFVTKMDSEVEEGKVCISV